MQTREQWKRSKDWKVVAAVATASALGLSGLALAGPSQVSAEPDPIKLDDKRSISEAVTPLAVEDVVANLLQGGSDSPHTADSPDALGSPDTADSPDGSNSPDGSDSPDALGSPDTADSPDGSNSPDGSDSPDSPDSADS